MKRAWSIGSTALVCAMAAGVATHAQSRTSTSSSVMNDKEVTVTGCLKSNDLSTMQNPAISSGGASSAGTANRAGANGTDTFVLTNAAMGAQPGGWSGSTSSTPLGSGGTDSAARAGATPPAGPVTQSGKAARGTYIVRGDTAELVRRVGQQVQVSGHLVDTKSSTGTPTTSQRSGSTGRESDRNPGASGSSTAMAGVQEIQATSVRMIGTICATD
ncbi:MAG: hypothetical protein U0Q11_08545 [Vicinamibacterales bacterium]